MKNFLSPNSFPHLNTLSAIAAASSPLPLHSESMNTNININIDTAVNIKKSSPPAVIFGLKDYPRPKNSGFFYCKPPSLFGNFNIKTLAVLDLFNTERQYITDIINKGIDSFIQDEEYADNIEYYLKNYETENMKPFVQAILKQVIENKLSQIKI